MGAALALAGQWVLRRAAKAKTAIRLAVAFWEELKAVNFYATEDSPNFAGFSSQTFDGLFREVAETLPVSLARDLMRYHWRMKYLESTKPQRGGKGLNATMCREAQELHGRLLERLDHYSKRSIQDVFEREEETCNPRLLAPSNAA